MLYGNAVFLKIMTRGKAVGVVVNVSVEMSIEMIKPARIRGMLLQCMAEMPFPDHRGLIACLLKALRDKPFLWRDAAIAPGH